MDRRVPKQFNLLAVTFISILFTTAITDCICNIIQCQSVKVDLPINDTTDVGTAVVELEDGIVVADSCDPFILSNNTLILDSSLRGENCESSSHRCELTCNESTVTVTIVFTVMRTDLYPPSFPAALFKANVSEGVPVGTEIFVFNKNGSEATDKDCWSARFYSFRENSQLFTIRGDGTVRTNMPIIYKEGQAYNMTIVATFRDINNAETEATTVLEISILDVDNQPPAFSTVKYVLDIKEEHVFPTGLQTVPPIYCRDLDSGINTTIHYNFTESNQYFEFQANGSWLLQKMAIDREAMGEWQSNINCFQADDPTKSDTAILQVNVIDINDNAARFDTTFLNVTLVENAFSGSYVAEVTATDADQGVNAVILYKISQESSTFQINNNTGVITVEDPELLDREKHSNLTVIAYAVDLQGNHSDNNVTVIVHLIDTNDNGPVFSKDVYRFYFNNSDLYSIIGMVSAIDKDVPNTPNSNVTYSVYQVWQDTTGGKFPFHVDQLTGNISINGSVMPSSRYSMIVEACDNPINIADRRCSLSRVIAGYSQNSSYSSISLTMEVVENSVVGTMIGQIPIRGDHYVVSSTDFIVDVQSQMLKTNIALDREAVDSYNITVEVFSDAIGPLGEVNIMINIEDMNDNPPVFDQDEYFFNFPLTPTASSIIGTLKATDADIGNNSERLYSFQHSANSKLFTIDPVSGTIVITDEWWTNRQSYFQLTALVSDLGMPPLQSSAQVYITEMLADEITNTVKIGTAADTDVMSANKTNLEREIAKLLGIERIKIALVENAQESQEHFRSYINITGFYFNGTSLSALELQRLAVDHWTPLQDLFRESSQYVYVTDTSDDGLKTAEIALIAMAGAIFVGAIIAIVVVCKQWNKHMKNQRLYETLRRPSTLYDSQEIRLEFGDERGSGHLNREFRRSKSKESEEQEGSFGLGYLNTAYLPDDDDDENAPKTPTWSTNDTPRIPRWNTSDSLKDAMESLEELTNRLNAEDNISRITSLSRERKSLRSYKSSNDGTPIVDDVQEKHKTSKDSDDYITPTVDYPVDKNNVTEDMKHEIKQTGMRNETEDGPAVFYVNSLRKHCTETAETEDKTVIVQATAL